jgi:hypothetical protein
LHQKTNYLCNPIPQDEGEDHRGEEALLELATRKQEAALVATIYYGSPEPTT